MKKNLLTEAQIKRMAAIAGIPVILNTVLAFNRLFSSNVVPVSSISPISGKSNKEQISIFNPFNDFCNSFSLSRLCVASIIFIVMFKKSVGKDISLEKKLKDLKQIG